MNNAQREQLHEILRSVPPEEITKELDDMIVEDVDRIAPVVDEWILLERDYFLKWAWHQDTCPAQQGNPLDCTCGLTAAIANKKKI